MKKIISFALSCLLLLTSVPLPTAAKPDNAKVSAKKSSVNSYIDTNSAQYIKSLSFESLSDPDFLRYIKDSLYNELAKQLGEGFVIEDIDAVYISKEYLEELAYNSLENIYFGHKLSEIEQQFQGVKYIFTLGEDGKTTVEEFKEAKAIEENGEIATEEKNDSNFYKKILKNVAIGSGVILLCVTVSVVSAGAGAPAAVSVILAASAKASIAFAGSGAVLGAVSAGAIEGVKTHNFKKALKAAALEGSEGFKWGAISGAVAGGAGKAFELGRGMANGLTLNEVAQIQRSSRYPIDVIKNINNMEQYNILRQLGLRTQMVNGKNALIRNIDLNYIAPGEKLTNLMRMQRGLAPLDPTGAAYELHHLGQHIDSTLAILTRAEHIGKGMKNLWHLSNVSEIDRTAFNLIRQAFWKDLAKQLSTKGQSSAYGKIGQFAAKGMVANGAAQGIKAAEKAALSKAAGSTAKTAVTAGKKTAVNFIKNGKSYHVEAGKLLSSEGQVAGKIKDGLMFGDKGEFIAYQSKNGSIITNKKTAIKELVAEGTAKNKYIAKKIIDWKGVNEMYNNPIVNEDLIIVGKIDKGGGAETLTANMEKVWGITKPKGSQAHHIVPKMDEYGNKLREILNKFKIDINDPRNGVYLPEDKKIADALGMAVHKGKLNTLHGPEFIDSLYSRFAKCNSREQVFEALNDYRQAMLKNDLFWLRNK